VDPPGRRFTLLPWLLCLLAVVFWITLIDSSRHEDGVPPHLPSPITEDPDIVAPDDPTSSSAPLATPSFTWYEGANGFAQGVEEARREGKPMAVYFYTDWCPYCRELEGELLGRAKVEDFLKHLVKIRVNPEKGTYERALADRYGVQGYPSFFIQPTPQATPRKIQRTDRNGLLTPEAFVANLEQATR
jgi:thiol:disulfide interchange protein